MNGDKKQWNKLCARYGKTSDFACNGNPESVIICLCGWCWNITFKHVWCLAYNFVGLVNSNYRQRIWSAPPWSAAKCHYSGVAELSGLHTRREVQRRSTERHLGWVKTQSRQYFRTKMGFMAQLGSAPMSYFKELWPLEQESEQRKE